jgi:glycosyltransferase involved in cell wall biosynthesis
VVFYGPGEFSDGVRLLAPAAGLAQAGHRVKVTRTPEPGDVKDFDVFVFARPMASPALSEALQVCRQAGKRVIVDVDDDFHNLPSDHPQYANWGPGNPAALAVLEMALAQADGVTVASAALAERYRPFAKRLFVVPSGWQRSNPLWDKPAPRRNTLNIGWIGGAADVADLNSIKPDVIQLVRQTPELLLVLGGDPAAFSAFDTLPELRRLFLPMALFEDYPYMLAHCDVLLAPARDIEFNRAKSDLKLVEAGVRRIPWVASPNPAYMAWGVGGLWADKPGEWLEALRKLVSDRVLRQTLGLAGRQKAETRESARLAEFWQAVLND